MGKGVRFFRVSGVPSHYSFERKSSKTFACSLPLFSYFYCLCPLLLRTVAPSVATLHFPCLFSVIRNYDCFRLPPTIEFPFACHTCRFMCHRYVDSHCRRELGACMNRQIVYITGYTHQHTHTACGIRKPTLIRVVHGSSFCRPVQSHSGGYDST